MSTSHWGYIILRVCLHHSEGENCAMPGKAFTNRCMPCGTRGMMPCDITGMLCDTRAEACHVKYDRHTERQIHFKTDTLQDRHTSRQTHMTADEACHVTFEACHVTF